MGREQRDTERETERDTEGQREIDGQKDRERQMDRETGRDRERDKDRETERPISPFPILPLKASQMQREAAFHIRRGAHLSPRLRWQDLRASLDGVREGQACSLLVFDPGELSGETLRVSGTGGWEGADEERVVWGLSSGPGGHPVLRVLTSDLRQCRQPLSAQRRSLQLRDGR